MENSEGSVSCTPRQNSIFTPGGGGGSMEGLRGRETGQDEGGPGPFPALPLLIYCIPFRGGESAWGESRGTEGRGNKAVSLSSLLPSCSPIFHS